MAPVYIVLRQSFFGIMSCSSLENVRFAQRKVTQSTVCHQEHLIAPWVGRYCKR